MRKKAGIAIVACLAVALGGLTGCNRETKGQELTVFAAASLVQVFKDVEEQVFRPAHPEVTVRFSFEGSSTLLDQLKAGAQADVLATANERIMKEAQANDLVQKPVLFATNSLTLIVPKGNPAKVTGLDASLEGTRLVICQPKVPCGTATDKLTKLMNIELKPVSRESKVTDVAAKVASGDADAGLVYQTDAKRTKNVESIDIPAAAQVISKYPIAATKHAEDAQKTALAQEFIDAVLSEQGQKILAEAGFGAPTK